MTAAALRRRRRALREWGELRRVRRAHPWVGPIDLAMLRRALRLAARAARRGEVPVGAVVYRGREVIAEAANDREATGDPTGHAEVVALREAGRRLGAWRLSGTRLAVTLEPCPMCAEEGQKLGQALWDFYHFQMHTLHSLHADPHPGNFIITPDRKLGVIDFGCVKVIPTTFHKTYFQLLHPDILQNEEKKLRVFKELRFIYDDDTDEDKHFFIQTFSKLVELLGRPFRTPRFDFSDSEYFRQLYQFGEEIGKMKEFRESKKARGVKDALYINRTYYGLYNLLNELKASIDTTSYVKL